MNADLPSAAKRDVTGFTPEVPTHLKTGERNAVKCCSSTQAAETVHCGVTECKTLYNKIAKNLNLELFLIYVSV